jgi:hypothetical protein
MDERRLRQEIQADLALGSGCVVYLEGKNDIPALAALLGIPEPRDDLFPGALVRAPGGRTTVETHVQVASEAQYPGVFGIIDGDGRPLDELTPLLDRTRKGPLFCWAGYSIENVLAKAGWPDTWGTPDWPGWFRQYLPYAALNRVHRQIQGELEGVGLHDYASPAKGQPLRTREQLEKDLLTKEPSLEAWSRRFSETYDQLEATIDSDETSAHHVINGKWFIHHLAPSLTSLSQVACREAWQDHVREQGGHPDVKALWKTITGRSL